MNTAECKSLKVSCLHYIPKKVDSAHVFTSGHKYSTEAYNTYGISFFTSYTHDFYSWTCLFLQLLCTRLRLRWRNHISFRNWVHWDVNGLILVHFISMTFPVTHVCMKSYGKIKYESHFQVVLLYVGFSASLKRDREKKEVYPGPQLSKAAYNLSWMWWERTQKRTHHPHNLTYSATYKETPLKNIKILHPDFKGFQDGNQEPRTYFNFFKYTNMEN